MKSIKITQKITERNCQSIDKYFKEVSDISLISKLDEERLFMRIKSGDMQARNELISANLRFVISISKQYLGRGLSLEDLISEGNIGLVKACDKFQPERGLKFITYAVWWIRQSILEAISQTGRDIRLPHNVNNLLNQIRSCEDKLTGQLSRTPHLSEVSDEMGIDISKLESILVLKWGSKSLDVSLSDDGDFSLIDTLQSEDEFDLILDLEDKKSTITGLMTRLNQKEEMVIRHLFGIGVKEKTIVEISTILGVTAERVRQIKISALNKMKK